MSDNFGFPFQPYEIQLKFMQSLTECLNESNIGIFSSPTGSYFTCFDLIIYPGTGKTLSLICGIMTWYRSHPELYFHDESNENLDISSDVPDWVKHHSIVRLKEQHEQLRISFDSMIKTRLERIRKQEEQFSKRKLDDFDDDILISTDTLSELDIARKKFSEQFRADQMENQEPVADIMKIIYSSRTHSQISQFINELKKTDFHRNTRIIHLGSRAQLCVHPKLKSLDNTTLTEKCKDLQKTCCPYFDKQDHKVLLNLRDKMVSTIRDIEDLLKLGLEEKCCSYYASRKAVELVEIICLPYSLLLSRETREAFDIKLTGNIVVIDEAHNLIDAIGSVYNSTLSVNVMKNCSEQISRYLEKYQFRLSGINVVRLKQVLKFLSKCISCLTSFSEPRSFKVDEFLLVFKLELFNYIELIDFIEESKLYKKLQMFMDKQCLGVDGEKKEYSASPLLLVKQFIQRIASVQDSGRVLVKIDDCGQYSLCYIVLDPSLYFQDIVDEAKSVILAGGTMDPMSDFVDQLFSESHKQKLKYFSCSHVIPDRNLNTFILKEGSSGRKFDFTFQGREDKILLKEAGQFLVDISAFVPGGIVVFFTSFSFMNIVLESWNDSTTILNDIRKKKKMFIEPRDSKLVEKVLLEYKMTIDKRTCDEQGAILFSVVGGKMSEGINFSDDYGRCVVVYGLPFPPPNDVELNEKKDFLNLRSNGSSNDFYENICMRAVNQSIGRAIRHRNDYAIVALIDSRYSSHRIRSKLPAWMNFSVTEQSYQNTIKLSKNFFLQHRKVET